MAVITIVTAQVTGNGLGNNHVAGETITAGMFVYKKTDDSNKVWLASSDTAATALVLGMALNNAVAGQPVAVITAGQVTVSTASILGSTGSIFCIAPLVSKGKMEDIDDSLPIPAVGKFVTTLGTAVSDKILDLNIDISGLARV